LAVAFFGALAESEARKREEATPLVTVSAVVTPAIAEEIDRLVAASGMSKSQLVRELLEAKLTERANER
jgi:metal-responsive CopG/Arc/MetJ family transcriptional regulator